MRAPGFWQNLKDFLTERPVKLPRNARPEVFHTEGLDTGFSENFKSLFHSAPKITPEAVETGITIEWVPLRRVFWRNLRDLIAPRKLPPLKLTSKPVAVRPLWGKRREFSVAQSVSIGMHAALAILILVPLAHKVVQSEAQANVNVVDVSPYLLQLPPGKAKAGGGGGGGEHMRTPPTRGKIPHFSMTQITPPLAMPHNLDPKLPAQPTLLGPPQLKVPSPNEANFGDPLAKMVNSSAGSGGGGGIGTGQGGGIGSGTGGGLGPGSGGGTGGGVYSPGTNGVGSPVCLYCPLPQYSEDARKAKYQGTVMVQAIIEPDGRATDIRVIKSPGLGLDEKAVEAVKTWRFKPALGPGGSPVATLNIIEINFRLL